MATLRKQEVAANAVDRTVAINKIEADYKRKVNQYVGEGSTFFLVILVLAILVYRAVKRQLKISHEQQYFMMAVTHELKTPIAVAQLNLETMLKRKLDEEQQQRLLKNTLLETTRLNSLCNNLLISSQMEAGGYKIVKTEVDFSSLTESSMHDFAIRFPDRDIRTELETSVLVQGDPMLFQIVVNNLIENALKYSPKNTPLSITLTKKAEVAVLNIIDNGPGISDEDKKKVFDKFYRIGNEETRKTKGTGLGLYLTKKIIIYLKGNIVLKDNKPNGSIFELSLPASV